MGQRADIVPLAEGLAGRQPGLRSAAEIALYDGTGIRLQDLVTARFVGERIEVAR
jgi:ornithine cyclodeaminase/alanine dehydrogenase-like protein (mu-crystallin family)